MPAGATAASILWISDFDKSLDTPDAKKVVPMETVATIDRFVAVPGNIYDVLTGMMRPGCDGSAGEPVLHTSNRATIVAAEEGGVWWFPHENRVEFKAARLAEEAAQTIRAWRDQPDAEGKARQFWIGDTAVAGFAKNEPEITAMLEGLGYTVIGKTHPLAINPSDSESLVAEKSAAVKALHQKSLAAKGMSGPDFNDRILQITYNADWIEYLALGINKTRTARALMDFHGCDLMIGTGDGANDSFLDVADQSNAVRNAVLDVKLRASRITEEIGGRGVKEVLDRAIYPKSARFASRAIKEGNLDRFWQQESGLELRQNVEYQRLVDAFFLVNPSIAEQCMQAGSKRDRLASHTVPYRVVRFGGGVIEPTTEYVSFDRDQAAVYAGQHVNDALGNLHVQRNMLRGKWLVTDTFQLVGEAPSGGTREWKHRNRVAEREESLFLRRPEPDYRKIGRPGLGIHYAKSHDLKRVVSESVERFGSRGVCVWLDGAATIPYWIKKYVSSQLRGNDSGVIKEAGLVDYNYSNAGTLSEILDEYLKHQGSDHPDVNALCDRRDFYGPEAHIQLLQESRECIFITDGNLKEWPKLMPALHTTVVVVQPATEKVNKQLIRRMPANADLAWVSVAEREKDPLFRTL